MKLKDYYEYLTDLIKDNPEILEFTVIYGRDDEGNGYHLVNNKPSVGFVDKVEYWMEGYTEWSSDPNNDCVEVVCIN